MSGLYHHLKEETRHCGRPLDVHVLTMCDVYGCRAQHSPVHALAGSSAYRRPPRRIEACSAAVIMGQ
jgi:hypothetical protein